MDYKDVQGLSFPIAVLFWLSQSVNHYDLSQPFLRKLQHLDKTVLAITNFNFLINLHAVVRNNENIVGFIGFQELHRFYFVFQLPYLVDFHKLLKIHCVIYELRNAFNRPDEEFPVFGDEGEVSVVRTYRHALQLLFHFDFPTYWHFGWYCEALLGFRLEAETDDAVGSQQEHQILFRTIIDVATCLVEWLTCDFPPEELLLCIDYWSVEDHFPAGQHYQFSSLGGCDGDDVGKKIPKGLNSCCESYLKAVEQLATPNLEPL